MKGIIATSDWHLSSVRPICRTDDDWVATQKKHINAVSNALKPDYDMVIAGDLFDTPTVTPVITNTTIDFITSLNNPVHIIAGNHDEPYHSIARIQESSFGAIRTIVPNSEGLFDFGTIAKDESHYPYVAVHTFAVPTENDKPPMRESVTAQDLCSMFPNTPIIIVGDNHTPWHKRIGNQLVVNCGCLMQRTAAEANKPCGFYIIYPDTLEVDYQDLSVLSDGCIDTTYLENRKEKELASSRYDALVEELLSSSKEEYDFIQTLELYIRNNELADDCNKILMELIAYIKEKKI